MWGEAHVSPGAVQIGARLAGVLGPQRLPRVPGVLEGPGGWGQSCERKETAKRDASRGWTSWLWEEDSEVATLGGRTGVPFLGALSETMERFYGTPTPSLRCRRGVGMGGQEPQKCPLCAWLSPRVDSGEVGALAVWMGST